MARPKKNIVRLSDSDVKRLKSMIRKKDTSQTTANRCRILLALDEAHPPCQTYDMRTAALGGRPVVCMDERPYQLLGEARDSWAMRPGAEKIKNLTKRDNAENKTN